MKIKRIEASKKWEKEAKKWANKVKSDSATWARLGKIKSKLMKMCPAQDTYIRRRLGFRNETITKSNGAWCSWLEPGASVEFIISFNKLLGLDIFWRHSEALFGVIFLFHHSSSNCLGSLCLWRAKSLVVGVKLNLCELSCNFIWAYNMSYHKCFSFNTLVY